MAQAMAAGQGTATWLSLGPMAVQSKNFGLVTGRISALALDPSDATGNTLYAEWAARRARRSALAR